MLADSWCSPQAGAGRGKQRGALAHGVWGCRGFSVAWCSGLPAWVFDLACVPPAAAGTLAAGINMPARTTIITNLSRRTDEGIELMPHNELLQMAGRAGRRGYDTEGHCIVLQNRWGRPEGGGSGDDREGPHG